MDFGQVIFNGLMCALIAWIFTGYVFRGTTNTGHLRRQWFAGIWVIFMVMAFLLE